MQPDEIADEIRRNGRCWLKRISLRTSANALEEEVEAILGIPLILTELPPEWEFALSTIDDYSIKEFEHVAVSRARLRKQGVADDDLPT